MPLNTLAPRPMPVEQAEGGHVVATPASIDEDVYVILDSLPDQPIGPVLGWRSAPEALWPQTGARCAIVTVSDARIPGSDGTTWFVGWDRP